MIPVRPPSLNVCSEVPLKAAHASPVYPDIRLSPICSFLPGNRVGGFPLDRKSGGLPGDESTVRNGGMLV